MTIELYKSALCPRCAYAAYILKKLQSEFHDLDIVTYDIVSDLSAFKTAGVKMIPMIKTDEYKKSWIFPAESEIRDFILKNK
jgi:predicted DsbA family dithiol-disulfide isomerase